MSCKLIMAEITRLHPGSDDQVIEFDLAHADAGAGHVDRSGAQVHSSHFAEHHVDIALLLGELPDRSGDLGRCQHRRRRLIEQRLENMVIAPVDQNDVGIGSSQSASRGDPSKATAHDHDALSPHLGCTCGRRAIASPQRRCLRDGLLNVLEALSHYSLSLRVWCWNSEYLGRASGFLVAHSGRFIFPAQLEQSQQDLVALRRELGDRAHAHFFV